MGWLPYPARLLQSFAAMLEFSRYRIQPRALAFFASRAAVPMPPPVCAPAGCSSLRRQLDGFDHLCRASPIGQTRSPKRCCAAGGLGLRVGDGHGLLAARSPAPPNRARSRGPTLFAALWHLLRFWLSSVVLDGIAFFCAAAVFGGRGLLFAAPVARERAVCARAW